MEDVRSPVVRARRARDGKAEPTADAMVAPLDAGNAAASCIRRITPAVPRQRSTVIFQDRKDDDARARPRSWLRANFDYAARPSTSSLHVHLVPRQVRDISGARLLSGTPLRLQRHVQCAPCRERRAGPRERDRFLVAETRGELRRPRRPSGDFAAQSSLRAECAARLRCTVVDFPNETRCITPCSRSRRQAVRLGVYEQGCSSP